jgi:hypothetical protein
MAGIYLDANCSKACGSVESLAERLPEAAGLDSDFNDHEGRIRDAGCSGQGLDEGAFSLQAASSMLLAF